MKTPVPWYHQLVQMSDRLSKLELVARCSWLMGTRCLQDFVKPTCKFNSNVAKTLKTDLCLPHDGVPLK
jgi:hypothetical protein